MSDTYLAEWADEIRQAVDGRKTVTSAEFQKMFGLTRRQMAGLLDRGDVVYLPTSSDYKTIPSAEVDRYLDLMLEQDRARSERAAG